MMSMNKKIKLTDSRFGKCLLNKYRLSEPVIAIISLALAFFHTLLTLVTDKLYFIYGNDLSFYLTLLNYKILLFIILFIFYYFLLKFIKYKKYKSVYFKIFISYFIIMMLLLILVYPGVWRNDDLGILLYAKTFKLESWHHILTSIIYILSLMIIPIPSGILVILNFIYSLIIAYIIKGISTYFNFNKWYYYVIMIIPFLLPPVLDNNLYPLRPIMYGYVELLLVFMLIFTYFKKYKISVINLLILSFLFAILITWRSESIIFIFLYLLIYIILIKQNKLNKKIIVILFICSAILMMFINYRNKIVLNGQYGNTYRMTLSEGFIKDATLISIKEADNVSLEKFNKVYDVNNMLVRDDWIGRFRRKNLNDKDVSEFVLAYAKFIIKHPLAFLENRFISFARTNAFVPNINVSIFKSSNLFDTSLDTNNKYAYNLLHESKGRFMHPLNRDLRKNIICFLEGNNAEGKTNIIFHIFWNSLIPIITLIGLFIFLVIKKKWYVSLIFLFVIIKLGIIFLATPENYFMYYFSEYILGYFCLSIIVCYLVKKKFECK